MTLFDSVLRGLLKRGLICIDPELDPIPDPGLDPDQNSDPGLDPNRDPDTDVVDSARGDVFNVVTCAEELLLCDVS